MIEKAERNNQASAPRWRSGEIGSHEHAWVTVGSDDQGETYRQCSICDARTNVRGPRDKARFQDWLEYRAEWGEEPGATVAEPVADDPAKTRAVIARTAEAVGQAKGAKKDKGDHPELVADDQAKTAAVIAATSAATKKDEPEDEEFDGGETRRGPGAPKEVLMAMRLTSYTGETHLWGWKDEPQACDYQSILRLVRECRPNWADLTKQCAYCGNAKVDGCSCGADKMVEKPIMLFWHKIRDGFWQQKSLNGPFWNGHPMAEAFRGTHSPRPAHKGGRAKKNP